MATVNKKGQATIFITLGIVLVFIISLALFFLIPPKDTTAETLASIESLDQAAQAVEDCIDEFLLDTFYQMGEHGGYIEPNTHFTTFQTPQELVALEQIEANLKTHIERNAATCSSVLKDTGFVVISNGRPTAEITFQPDTTLEISSIGVVQKEESADQTLTITKRAQEIELDFIEMYNIINQTISNKHGIPIESHQGFVLNTFVNQDYTQQLIRLHNIETEFVFRTTKLLS